MTVIEMYGLTSPPMVRISTSNPIAFNQRRIELRKAARSHAMHIDIEILIVKKWTNHKILVDDLSACSFQDLTKKRASHGSQCCQVSIFQLYLAIAQSKRGLFNVSSSQLSPTKNLSSVLVMAT